MGFKDKFDNAIFRLKKLDKKSAFVNNALVIVLVGYVIVAAVAIPNFMSFGAIFTLLNRIGRTLPMALGMGTIMIVGGTDLSAGRASGLVGLVCASLLMQSGLPNQVFVGIGKVPVILPLLLCLVIGALISIINAVCIIKLRLHPFIMTLAMSMVLYGVMFWYLSLGTNGNKPISTNINSSYWQLVNSGFFVQRNKLNYYVFVVIAIAVAMWVIYNKTNIGRNMYAVGCNRDAAVVSGISIFKTTLICFAIAGALFGLTGFINAAQGASTIDSGNGLDLNAIAACIIGGVSFAGGVGKISGIIFGVFLMNLIQLSLVFLDVHSNYASLITGAIIIVAVAIDMRKSIVRR